MRDQRRVDGQAIFVGVDVIVGNSRHVDNNDVGRSDVVLGVPDLRRNVDEAAMMLGHQNLAYLAVGRGLRPRVEQDELHFPRQDEVAILVSLMQRPPFGKSRTDGEAMQRSDRSGIKAPSLVENFKNASSRVAVGLSGADL